jgi:glycosyltransferase involved in cell wall biosynthesis
MGIDVWEFIEAAKTKHFNREPHDPAVPAKPPTRLLIFLNRYFHPDHSATSQMLSDLAFMLAERGRAVAVITSRQRYDAPEVRLPARESVANVDIHRVWTSRFGRASLLGRALDYITFYPFAAHALWRLTAKGDVIVAMTDPPMLSVVVAPIAHWRGARLVNWLQDLFPEVAEAVGFGRRQLPGFVYGALRAPRDWSLRSAAMNVVLGERMAEKLAALGVAPDRVGIVENWADRALIEPIEPGSNALRREWGFDGKFVVGYSGNLGRAHEFDTVLDAITRLEKRAPDSLRIVWLFVGGGALHDAFAGNLRARGLKSVVFKPYQPRDLLARSLSAADVHLVCLKPELEGLIVPSKFYGIAAAGRPTIFVGDRNGEIARIVQRRNLGFAVNQGDGAELAERILALARDPGVCREIGARARQACEHEFDKRIAIDRWEALLARLPV